MEKYFLKIIRDLIVSYCDDIAHYTAYGLRITKIKIEIEAESEGGSYYRYITL